MPVFEEQRPQIWKCIFVADLLQAQTECFWLTKKKVIARDVVMSGGDSKVVVLPITMREPNMESTSRRCSIKRQAYW